LFLSPSQEEKVNFGWERYGEAAVPGLAGAGREGGIPCDRRAQRSQVIRFRSDTIFARKQGRSTAFSF